MSIKEKYPVEIKDDLISRKDALSAIDGICATNERELVIKSLAHTMLLSKSMVPTIDAAPVVHGRWVKMTGMMPPEYHGHYCCSECEWHMKGLRNSWTREEELSYCPNCGARMDGGNAAHG